MEVEFLNHASVIIRSGNTALLTDPWYSGTAFNGSWGLRYNNPRAMEKASQVEFLWISHPHEDHLHIPTLRELAKRNPKMRVLANTTGIINALKPLGFREFHLIPERKPINVGTLTLTRYPSSFVDNMLLIEAEGKKILNLNDCNLPKGALKSFAKRFGKLDLLMLAYNHANKLTCPRDSGLIQIAFMEKFRWMVDIFKPQMVLPFASSHYYRSKSAWWQNESLLEVEQLGEFTPKIKRLDKNEMTVNENEGYVNPNHAAENEWITGAVHEHKHGLLLAVIKENLEYLKKPSFYWNRREELFWMLLGLKLKLGIRF